LPPEKSGQVDANESNQRKIIRVHICFLKVLMNAKHFKDGMIAPRIRPGLRLPLCNSMIVQKNFSGADNSSISFLFLKIQII
jgi:hypothetical protein